MKKRMRPPAPKGTGYSYVRADFANDPRISMRARSVYMYLNNFPMGQRPGVHATAKALRLSPRSVEAALQELTRMDYMGALQ